MKKVRKLLALLLAAAMVLALSACDSQRVNNKMDSAVKDSDKIEGNVFALESVYFAIENGDYVTAYTLLNDMNSKEASELREKFIFLPEKVTYSDENMAGTFGSLGFTYDENGYLLAGSFTAGRPVFNTGTGPRGEVTARFNLEWDDKGRLHKEVYNDGSVCTYSYDDEGNLLAKEYVDGKDSSRSYETIYTYDDNGNVLTKKHIDCGTSDNNDEVTYVYDDKNFLLSEKHKNVRGNYEIQYTYENSKLCSMKLVGIAGVTESISVDSNGTLTRKWSDADEMHINYYCYDENGNLMSIECDSDPTDDIVDRAYEWNEDNCLLSETSYVINTVEGTSTVLIQQAYQYDQNGNLISVTYMDAYGIANDLQYDVYEYSYKYDAFGNVVEATYDEGKQTISWKLLYFPNGVPETIKDISYWIYQYKMLDLPESLWYDDYLAINSSNSYLPEASKKFF